jgi:hemerythrin-like domain-containing protein
MTSVMALHDGPAASFEAPFEMLEACHQRVERMLVLLERLAAHLQAHGADEQARQAVRDVMRYFDTAAPQHHEDEERHVLPRLRAHGQAALAERLQSEHHAMSAAWAALRPVLQAIEQGRWPSGEAPAITARWHDFAALYRSHIAFEEGQAYRAALPHFDADALRAMGHEMARRRGG